MNRASDETLCKDQPDGVAGCECQTLFGIGVDFDHLDEGHKDALLDFFGAVTHTITERLVQVAAITADIVLTGEQVQAVTSMIHEKLEADFDGHTWIDVTSIDPADIASWVRQAGQLADLTAE